MDKTFPSNLGDIIANVTGTVGATTPSAGTFTDLTASALELNELSFPYDIDTYVPVVTLAGGTGNTVPQYLQNVGRYVKIGSICYVFIYLNADGGDEGAGTGEINISLPFQADETTRTRYSNGGYYRNGTAYYLPLLPIGTGASVVRLCYYDAVAGTMPSFTAVMQNSTTRTIGISFVYETV